MILEKLFPCAIAACLALGLSAIASAQSVETRQRQVAKNIATSGPSVLSDEPVIISLASPEDIKAAAAVRPSGATSGSFQDLMLSAIDQRLGTRYSWGATGPSAFDCSGFVWSAFQSAGITFERGSARALWARFERATPEEEATFGTLVFFNGLKHIGIVADANGFYHASRHHGVVYSPFSDYWRSRIDGFRRIPLREVPVVTEVPGVID